MKPSRVDQGAVWTHRIASEAGGGVPILALAGRFGFAATADLANAIDRLLVGSASMVVDLGQVEYVSSGSLDVLVRAAERCAGGGGVLALVIATDPVRLALEFSGSIGVFAIAPTREAALALVRR